MQPLFELTLRTIREDQEEVALNAIEFWSSLCEEEVCMHVCPVCMLPACVALREHGLGGVVGVVVTC